MMGDELYAWQVQEPDGRWSMIGTQLAGSEMYLPMIHRDLQVIQNMTTLAKNHARQTGQRLRLAHFALSEVLPNGAD